MSKIGGSKHVKAKSRVKLKERLWTIFSEYIRLRDSDPFGNCKCISCGKIIPAFGTTQCHAGHYYPKIATYEALRFNEYNVNAQCVQCNMHMKGNTQKYREGLIEKYGIEIVNELDAHRHDGAYLKTWDYEEMIKRYKGLVEVMKNRTQILNNIEI